MSNIALILIIGSACCAVIGAVLAVIRGTRFVRNQRSRENNIELQGMLEERRARKEPEATQE